MKNKSKTHKLILEFDNKEAADNFTSHWLDGGGDGGGNIDWNTSKWDKKNTKMRIKGTGWAIEWIDGEMIVMTPENEEIQWEKRRKSYGVQK